MNDINKNTYYMLPRWFVHSCISISRATSGKYYLTNRDNKKGYFITLELNNISLKVPFRALFDTNDKIKPIVSLSFSSAIYCPSDLRGLCQLKDSNMSCYAKNGQKRACGDHTSLGIPCINSLMNSFLVMACLNILYNNIELLGLFSIYITKNYPIVRFNLKGDFKDFKDLYILSFLVKKCTRTVFYGYSARDDILFDLQGYKNYLRNDNCYLNGSNEQYTNLFKATYDLKEWFISNYKCLGGCMGCMNCFKLRNKTINCLVHNKNSDIVLNSLKNRVFLKKLLKCYGLNIKNSDLKIKSGLLESLNYYLNDIKQLDIFFESFLDLYYYLTNNYEIWDNIEQIDLKGLQALGVI